MKPACGLIFIVFLLSLKVTFGQTEDNSALDKKINIEAKNETVASVLDKITSQSHIFFSYDATLVNTEKKIDASLTDKTIREILNVLFESKCVYHVLDDQIVITIRKSEDEKKKADEMNGANPGIIVFRGKVIDGNERDALPYSSISVQKRNIGTISNTDGEFELKIPGTMIDDTVVVSCLGYRQFRLPVAKIDKDVVTVYLQPTIFQFQEVNVTYISPQEILRRFLSKITLNYAKETEIMTSFYREVLKQDQNYIDVAEAVMEIQKSAYDNSCTEDKVKYIKGRKSLNVKPFQFIDFKIQGGPYYITKQDVVKTLDSFLDPAFFELYKYSLDEIVEYDNRDTYVVRFKPKEKVEDQSYQGKLFIDMSSFALVHAEFELSRSGLKFGQQSLIKKKPKDFYVRPIQAKYQVSYRRSEGKWHLSNAENSIKFRVKSKKDQINSIFHSTSDLVITDFKTDDGTHFKRNEIFGSKDIFTEVVTSYDEAFWGEYNTIKPSEDLINTLQKYYQENDSLFQQKQKVEERPIKKQP
jgi:hypothetical protein